MRRYLNAPVARAASAVAAPYATSRLLILAAGVAGALFPLAPELVRPPVVDAVAHMFERWDTMWYLNIAWNGYAWNGDPMRMQNVVFFPLFPMLMRAVGTVAGGRFALGGAAISLAAFFLACVQLWRLVVFEMTDRAGAERAEWIATAAVALLCAFPFSIYYAVAYTESLFLLFAVSAFLAARRGAFLEAAAFGLLVGLTRPNGMVLAIPIAWIAFAERRGSAEGPAEAGRHVRRAVAVVAPLLGTAVYSIYLHYAVGDGFAWYKGQAAWHWIAPEAKANVVHALRHINAQDLYVGFAGVCPGLLALVAIVPVTIVLGPAYGLFIAVGIAPAILTHGFMSAGRFTSVLFPLFVWIASTIDDRVRLKRLVWVGLAAQALVAELFFAGWPMV